MIDSLIWLYIFISIKENDFFFENFDVFVDKLKEIFNSLLEFVNNFEKFVDSLVGVF